MEQLIIFHDHSITLILLITCIVLFNLISTTTNKIANLIIIESNELELFWTITPSLVLILIGIPSIRLLYLSDEVFNPILTIKTMGHQWYWSYEFTDFINIEFDSFLIPKREYTKNIFRLLDTDNQVHIPVNTQIRNLISAADVLHAWTIPSLGIKVDAIPGRLNQVNFLSNTVGSFYGQCSEICGANHRFIPITLNSVPTKYFIQWIKNNSLSGW